MPSATSTPDITDGFQHRGRNNINNNNNNNNNNSSHEYDDLMDIAMFSSSYLPPAGPPPPPPIPPSLRRAGSASAFFSSSSSSSSSEPLQPNNRTTQQPTPISQSWPVQPTPPAPFPPIHDTPEEFLHALNTNCPACSVSLPLTQAPPGISSSSFYPIHIASFTAPHSSDPYRPSHKLFIQTHPHSYPFRGLYLYVSAEDMRFHAHPGAEPDTVVGYLGHERLGRIGAGRESLRIFRDLCSGMYMPPVGFPGWEPPQFKEAEWVGEALLMGRWMGMLELDMDRRPGRMNRPMFW